MGNSCRKRVPIDLVLTYVRAGLMGENDADAKSVTSTIFVDLCCSYDAFRC